MMHQLTSYPRVGAVTGNPRIINRSSILGKLQVGEFSSIIGLIKRAQRTYGRIFCVSGAIAGFRKTALDRIGYWSADMITEAHHVSRQFEGHVVARQVGRPQKAGLAELDGCREEAVQRKPDRHLQYDR